MNRILVVDDHPVTREPLVRLLQLEGYDAAAACNGEEALASMETRSVDLVLLDLMMPRMDGVNFLQAIRGDARWRATPVIMLTATPEGSQLARARELNVKAIMQKAKFALPELFDRIRGCLAAGAADRQAGSQVAAAG